MMIIKKSKKITKRKKYNRFIPKEARYIDYKDTDLLKRFTNNQGKIILAATSGLNAQQQRALAQAIKRARQMALMPYTKERVRR